MANTRGLQPAYREIIDWLYQYLEPHGFVITSGLRTYEEQAKLYEAYRASLGKPLAPGERIFQALPPGRSQHERGWAVDLARPGVHPQADELLAALGAWWRAQGGVWGGPADPVHFEAPKAWTGRS